MPFQQNDLRPKYDRGIHASHMDWGIEPDQINASLIPIHTTSQLASTVEAELLALHQWQAQVDAHRSNFVLTQLIVQDAQAGLNLVALPETTQATAIGVHYTAGHANPDYDRFLLGLYSDPQSEQAGIAIFDPQQQPIFGGKSYSFLMRWGYDGDPTPSFDGGIWASDLTSEKGVFYGKEHDAPKNMLVPILQTACYPTLALGDASFWQSIQVVSPLQICADSALVNHTFELQISSEKANASLVLDASGFIIRGKCASNLAAFTLVYAPETDGDEVIYEKIDTMMPTKMGAIGLTLDSGSENIRILLQGIVSTRSLVPNMWKHKVGRKLYAHNIQPSTIAPKRQDECEQIVGYVLTPDTILFQPSTEILQLDTDL